MRKKIYFITSYVCLKEFLALINKEDINYVFFTENILEIKNFLKMIKDYNITYIQIKKDRNFFKKNNIIFEEADEIYYFSNVVILELFIILEKLNHRKIIFCDSEMPNLYRKIKIRDYFYFKNFFKICRNYIQAKIYKINLESIFWKDSNGITIIYNRKYRQIEKPKKEWEEIKKKINYQNIIIEKSILYIEQPIEELRIDKIKTKENILKVLYEYEKRNYKIYVKMHPRSKEKEIYKNFNIIDKGIPSEFLSQDFEIYLTMYSSGIKSFLKTKKCYSLLEYMCFKKNEDKKYLENFLSSELKGIKVLKK